MRSNYNRKYSLESFYSWGLEIYNKTPDSIRFIFVPFKILLAIIRILSKVSLWIITGEEANSKQDIVIIYAGSEKNKHYLVNLAFADNSYKENYIGKAWIWGILRKAKGQNHDCSLMIVEVPKVWRLLFNIKKGFYMPCWVSGEIDISADISSLTRKKGIKNDLRKLIRNKLDFEITNEMPRLDDFYNNMYLPFINKAHRNEAIIEDYNFVKSEFKKCDLLLIKSEKQVIGGNLIVYEKNKARMSIFGVKDGNLDYIERGVIVALYYFSICYLKDKGFRRLNLGRSRPFLKDGVLQYKKRKWGLEITGISETGFLVKPLAKTEGLKRFFLNNPFIYMGENNFKGAIFMESNQLLSTDDFWRLYKDYYLAGLSKLFVYVYGENANRLQENLPPELAGKMIVCQAEDF